MEREPVKVFKPEQIIEQKINNLPDEVIEAANMLVVENFSYGYGSFKLNELTKLLKSVGFNVGSIKDKDWVFTLVEKFKAEGWEMEVDYPSMDQDYEPFISFEEPARKKRRGY